jgi:UDP-glucose:(heptosyl)LPS alpha-1,3-glucosyltransferase
MSKKIAILKNTFNSYGGLEKQTNLIAKAFLEKGFCVSIVTTKPKNINNLPADINFHFMKKWAFFSFFKILFFERQTASWIKKNKPEIILGIDRTTKQTHIRAGNGVHKAYLQNRKKYFSMFNYLICKINPLHHLVLKIEKKAFESSFLKKIIVNSYMVKTQILKYYHLSSSKIKVVHNGVQWKDLEKDCLASIEKKIKISKELNIDPQKHNFLFVGNGYKRKGLLVLLKAASALKNKDFNILIIGKDKKIKKYKKYAKELSLEKNTFFFEKQKNITPFYQIADTFVLPTYYDPFANTTVEALAMGLYTITSKENGAHEIINEKNGIIIENLLDFNEITDILTKAMIKNKTLKSILNIRNTIKHLDISNQLNKIIKIINE